VGTALTAQTAIGFLLTIVTIQLIPLLAGAIGWRYAFVALAAGPAAALPAMTTLNRRSNRDRHAIPLTATERTSP
jgi:predicted MFS family arabinose efflux permease